MSSEAGINAIKAMQASNQTIPSELSALRYRSDAEGEPKFDETLEAQLNVHFSNHAQRRLDSRAINLASSDLKRLTQAVDRAESKGARDSLILMDKVAFVVDVQQRLVVTAVDASNQKEGIFTNIDSVVLAD